jgi:hypothetical protein
MNDDDQGLPWNAARGTDSIQCGPKCVDLTHDMDTLRPPDAPSQNELDDAPNLERPHALDSTGERGSSQRSLTLWSILVGLSDSDEPLARHTFPLKLRSGGARGGKKGKNKARAAARPDFKDASLGGSHHWFEIRIRTLFDLCFRLLHCQMLLLLTFADPSRSLRQIHPHKLIDLAVSEVERSPRPRLPRVTLMLRSKRRRRPVHVQRDVICLEQRARTPPMSGPRTVTTAISKSPEVSARPSPRSRANLSSNTGVYALLRLSSPRACDDTGKSNDLARRRATESHGTSCGKALSRAGAYEPAPASVGWCKDKSLLSPLFGATFPVLMPFSSHFSGKG